MARAKKLQPRFIGPYKIVKTLPYHTYRLSRDGKETVEHEARMKLCITDRDYNRTNDLPRPNPIPKNHIPRTKPQPKISYPVQPSITFIPDDIPPPTLPNTLEIESLPSSTPGRFEQLEENDIYPAIEWSLSPEQITQEIDTPTPATCPDIHSETEFPALPKTPAIPTNTARSSNRRSTRPPARYRDYELY
jgi:hypothetical protein